MAEIVPEKIPSDGIEHQMKKKSEGVLLKERRMRQKETKQEVSLDLLSHNTRKVLQEIVLKSASQL